MNQVTDQSFSDRPADERRLIEEGARTLDRLVGDRLPIERTTVIRSFHQVAAKSEVGVADHWWQLMSDASATLHLRPSVMDCSIDQIVRLARDGADLVLFCGKESVGEGRPLGWVLIKHSRGKRFQWWAPGSVIGDDLKSNKRFRARLSTMAIDQRIRCVAFDWQENSIAGGPIDGQTMRPLQRVQQLLRAEWSDIYLVTVFAFVVGLLTLATPIAVESLVNTVAFGRFLQPIVVLSVLLLTFLGFSAAIKALQTYIVEIVQQRLFARVSSDLAHRLPRISVEANEEKYMPELVNRFFDVVTVQKVAAFLLLDGISLILSVLIGMAVLGFYHPFLLGFDILLLACMAFLILVLGRGAVKTAQKESKSKYYMAGWLEDVARCQSTFTSAAGKNLSVGRTDRLVHEYLVNRKKHFRVLFRQIMFALGLQAIASTALLGLGGYLVLIGELTIGQLVAAELIVAVIVGAFAKMGKHLESFYDLCASVDKLGALFDLPLARQGTILQSIEEVPPVISLESVTYKRGKSSGGFSSITVNVPSGSSLAVLGPSGSGKSTVLDLIYGHRRPTGGQVKVDGIQPWDLQSDDFWNHAELVRDGEVFAGTIEENIHLQRNDISGQEVDDALKAVGLRHLVTELKDGLQTHVASHGAPLTANQVRLMLLARGIAARPSLLLIDGVLDALPDDELDLVMDSLTDPDAEWTLVVATGRSTIADRFARTLQLPLGKVFQSDLASSSDNA